MDPKESRRARRRNEKNQDDARDKNGINRGYYIVIGVLVLILVGLVIFLFTRDDDSINLDSEEETSLVGDTSDTTEENNDDLNDNTTENEEPSSEDESEETNATNDADEENEDEEETDEETETDAEVGETVVVNEDAPHDPSYEVDYNEGSADLATIVDEAREATGLETFTQWFVAYDGPAQVVATVANTSQSEYYEVYLQYGDGNWHVTSYERLANNPF